jgi:hypothetical protein
MFVLEAKTTKEPSKTLYMPTASSVAKTLPDKKPGNEKSAAEKKKPEAAKPAAKPSPKVASSSVPGMDHCK